MIETLVLNQGFKLFSKEEFPSLKKNPIFPLRVHYLLKVAFLEMLTRILNEQIKFKNHLLNIYQPSGLFKRLVKQKGQILTTIIVQVYKDEFLLLV